MTKNINLEIDDNDLEEFKAKTGMSVVDCIKILINSIKYSGKLELDTFWSDENMKELKNRINSGKFERHDLIEVD